MSAKGAEQGPLNLGKNSDLCYTHSSCILHSSSAVAFDNSQHSQCSLAAARKKQNKASFPKDCHYYIVRHCLESIIDHEYPL